MMKREGTKFTSACFDCGTVATQDASLWSVTVRSQPRDTSRGKILPPAGSIALCKPCFDKEAATNAA